MQLADLNPTRNVTESKLILILCNINRQLVLNFARVVAPVNEKLRKVQSCTFDTLSQEVSDALARVQETPLSTRELALPRSKGLWNLDTDACDKEVGCVLMQDQQDRTKNAIIKCIRAFIPAHQNYDTTRQDCLAVVWSLLFLNHYLKRRRFTIRMIHDV